MRFFHEIAPFSLTKSETTRVSSLETECTNYQRITNKLPNGLSLKILRYTVRLFKTASQILAIVPKYPF